MRSVMLNRPIRIEHLYLDGNRVMTLHGFRVIESTREPGQKVTMLLTVRDKQTRKLQRAIAAIHHLPFNPDNKLAKRQAKSLHQLCEAIFAEFGLGRQQENFPDAHAHDASDAWPEFRDQQRQPQRNAAPLLRTRDHDTHDENARDFPELQHAPNERHADALASQSRADPLQPLLHESSERGHELRSNLEHQEQHEDEP